MDIVNDKIRVRNLPTHQATYILGLMVCLARLVTGLPSLLHIGLLVLIDHSYWPSQFVLHLSG